MGDRGDDTTFVHSLQAKMYRSADISENGPCLQTVDKRTLNVMRGGSIDFKIQSMDIRDVRSGTGGKEKRKKKGTARRSVAPRTVLPEKLEEFGLENVPARVRVHHVVKLVVPGDDRCSLKKKGKTDGPNWMEI